jgi:heme exporter protein C
MEASSVSTHRYPYVLLVAGVICLIAGSSLGLFVAPAEQYMGDVQRIMYVHVPTAWNWMLVVLFSLGSAMAFLFMNDPKWDARMEAGLEMGSLLAFLLCCQGSIWAKPTWGVWWDWDPRLTSTAVLLFAFLGILALRKFVDDPSRRAIWSAVATIIASVDLPIVYFSVKWWNSLHQQPSSPETVSSTFHLPLRLNAIGILLVVIALAALRSRVAGYRLRDELVAPPAFIVPEPTGELA